MLVSIYGANKLKNHGDNEPDPVSLLFYQFRIIHRKITTIDE